MRKITKSLGGNTKPDSIGHKQLLFESNLEFQEMVKLSESLSLAYCQMMYVIKYSAKHVARVFNDEAHTSSFYILIPNI